ncbi:MAG: FeoC-like transcriptional regulator [Rhodospirillales bacterium]|nr:FeoC-like transcriptional regulator [Rhodospirillales bacterium]
MATLMDVKSYLSERKRASLSDIAVGLGTTADAAKALLDVWIEKARIRRLLSDCGGTCNKSCCETKGGGADVYEWIDKAGRA